MKIHDAFKQLSSPQNKLGGDDKRSLDSKDKVFENHLTKINEGNYREKLLFLLDEIDKQGQSLSKSVDIRELKRYKKLISEFLYDAVNNSHKFHKESLLDRRGRHRVYSIISKVNKELEQLTEQIIKKEDGNIKILQKLDDIRGLLLDILM